MRRSKRILTVLAWVLLLVCAVICITTWLYWGNTTVGLTEITVTSDQLPEAFDGFRIAQISDLHNAQFGEGNEELLEILRGANPDMIAFTGDIIDYRTPDLSAVLDFAAKAAQIAPCYYITGNHEYGAAEFSKLEAGLADAGVVVLRNRAAVLLRGEAYIRLIGMDDYAFFDSRSGEVNIARMKDRLSYFLKDGYNVLLCHRCELFPRFQEMDIDLVLAGHAHGGQVRLPFVGGLYAPDQAWFPEYDAGLYTQEQMHMVVSRGLGSSKIPLRVNNRPEVVIITLTNS